MSVQSAIAADPPGACSVLVSSLGGRIPSQRNGSPSCEGVAQAPDAGVVSGLVCRLGEVPDHRASAWVDHPLAAVLALCAAAVVAGMRSFTAIAGWVADVPGELLAVAYAGAQAPVPARGPSKSTIWRVLTGLDNAALDTAIGQWLLDQAYPDQGDPDQGEPGQGDPGPENGSAAAAAGPLDGVAVAADGKTCRGAKNSGGEQVHLMAAMTHETGLVLAQTDVGAKTNEVPRLKDLLSGLAGRVNLRGMVLTVDALHTVRDTARWLHAHGIEYVMTVKHNIPTLFDALDALPWHEVPVAHVQVERGHGRITRRTIQTLPAPDDLPFPHVGQAFLIERSVTDLRGANLSSIAALGVTSQTPDRADPARLAHQVQGHWAIESLHWIRDHVYREDQSTTRTHCGPRAMASLRNLAIGAHRLIGRTDIAEATRWAGRNMTRPFQILNLDQES